MARGGLREKEWFIFQAEGKEGELWKLRYFSTLSLASVRNSDFKEDGIFNYTILL